MDDQVAPRQGVGGEYVIRKVLHAMHERLRLRGWVAVGVALAMLTSAPRALRSRFVTERRAAFSLKRAQAHVAARQFDDARRDFRAALLLQPANAGARLQLATMELGLGNPELAFLEFQTLTELHPEDPNGWIGLADLLMKGGVFAAPEAALDNAIAAAPGRADARLLRADVRFRLGRYHGAFIDANAAAAERPNDAASWELLLRSAARSPADAGIEAAERGVAAVGPDPALLRPMAYLLAERGREREAITILQELVSTHSGSPAAWGAQLTLARIYLRARKPEPARKQLDALLLQRSRDEDALALRAIIDAAGGRVEAALAQLDAALESLPTSRVLRDVRGRLQSARTDPAGVAVLVAEMTSRDLGPAPVASSRVLAEAQMGSGKFAALAREHWAGRLAQMRQALEAQLRQQNWNTAERIVASAQQAYAGTAFAPFLAGVLELARGNADQAEKDFSESLAAAPRSPVVAAALAKTWSRRNGAAFAGEQLMRLTERDAGFTFASYLAARAYMDSHDPTQAEVVLRRGIELQPSSPLPYRHLADYYLEVDRPADALATCQQGLERLPHDIDLELMLAQVSADLGRAKEAIRIYDDVLSRRPDLDVVEYKLAALVASQDKDEESPRRSVQIVQHLHSDMPSDPLLLDTLGWVHFRAGLTMRARELVLAAVNASPDEPSPHFHLALIYAREKKAALARAELQAAVDSRRPFTERLDALRLLRENSSAPAPKGTASDRSLRP